MRLEGVEKSIRPAAMGPDLAATGTKCLIIAAGKGSRLRERGDVKPLIRILGVPLIERVIRSAIEAGADDFYVVTGYQGKQVREFLDGLAVRLGVPITAIVNDAWEKENGLSVLRAREYLHESFLLLMADHLFDPSIARKLMEFPLADGEIILGVDKCTKNPLIDMEDVTRVRTEDGKIVHIGKGLVNHDGFDTGVFACTPVLFDALERSAEESGDTSLSGAVQILSDHGLAKALDVSNLFWIDVDDAAACRKAEKALLDDLRGKSNDGPVSRYLNRPISVMFSRHLVRFDITPSQISLFSFVCCLLAAGLFTLGGYLTLFLGGLLAQFASIIDGSDGEVARLKFQTSDYGGWFDAVMDRYADALLLFGLTWHVYVNMPTNIVLWVGFVAIIGSFMLSYTADKYDSLMRERIGKGLRLGRDIRVFLIFLGALFNQAFVVLIAVAVVMNIETIRRVIICRDRGSIERARERVRAIVAGSTVPEDRRHAENTLKWLLKLDPDAGQSLQIAALAHDIDRAVEFEKVRRADFDDYDETVSKHANGCDHVESAPEEESSGAQTVKPDLAAAFHVSRRAC